MRKITIADYDRQWPELFNTESALLQLTLGKVISRIYHVGSTSVPGLAAKPIIDILLEVTDLNALDKFNAAMVHAGYSPRGEKGIPGRRYFTKGRDQRTHHLHAFSAGDSQIIRHLAFRDYLRENPQVAARYAGIKRAAALAGQYQAHRYSALKADFIAQQLRRALIDLEQ